MTVFEWTVIGLIVIGVVVPFWIMIGLVVMVSRRRHQPVILPPGRASQYVVLMREFEHAFNKTKDRNNKTTRIEYTYNKDNKDSQRRLSLKY